jgi:hypothetical protein
MIGPYETRRCGWCDQPAAECECDLDDVTHAECPCGNGCWDDDFDDCSRTARPVVTVDTGGLT